MDNFFELAIFRYLIGNHFVFRMERPKASRVPIEEENKVNY